MPGKDKTAMQDPVSQKMSSHCETWSVTQYVDQ